MLTEFTALTGNSPFNWQKRLYGLLQKGIAPEICDVPTGLGKTSVIALWLIALAKQLEEGGTQFLPRRLIYIVDRRVVVDQATDEVLKFDRVLKEARTDASHPLNAMVRALGLNQETGDESVIAISTLRGKKADNQDWLREPGKPTIIVGTVDMIGSRLLFSPYGRVGRSRRAMQAGLMGQDALIVVDEAHLCPSFIHTLRSIKAFISQRATVRPFQIMELSATQAGPKDAASHFSLEESQGDFKDAEVSQRLHSVKRLNIIRASAEDVAPTKQKVLVESMAQHAVELAGKKESVVVFANTVGMVQEIAQILDSKGDVVMLTGEMRGFERDSLVEQNRLKWFARRRDRKDQTTPAFLVATACAEVGINFDADHAVCDVVPLERMIQRFGRVNRFGDGAATIRVMDAGNAQEHHRATIEVLNQLASENGTLDACPAALQSLDRSRDAFKKAWSPAPPCPVLDEARLDDWSMTSFCEGTFNGRLPTCARPQVGYWLRGLVADTSVMVNFVWREELDQCADADDAIRMARFIPPAQREIATISIVRVPELLKSLAKSPVTGWVVHCDEGEEWLARRLSDMILDERFIAQIRSGTVYLPARAGGLKDGNPDPACTNAVTDQVNGEEEKLWLRPRLRTWAGNWCIVDESWSLTEDDSAPPLILHTLEEDETTEEAVQKVAGITGSSVVGISGDEEKFPDLFRVIYLRLSKAPQDGIALSVCPQKVTLDSHTDDVVKHAERFCRDLRLETSLATAVITAALWHDVGKGNLRWQAAIGCTQEPWLAKSNSSFFDYREMQGYRHEFGSLTKALRQGGLTDDLILHLIASHHGWARPVFPPDAYDPDECDSEAVATEAALRFARLQQKLGWWQLAYLESLLKAADALASQSPTPCP